MNLYLKSKKDKHRIVCFQIDQIELNRIVSNNLGNIKVEIVVSHANINIKTTTTSGNKVKLLK